MENAAHHIAAEKFNGKTKGCIGQQICFQGIGLGPFLLQHQQNREENEFESSFEYLHRNSFKRTAISAWLLFKSAKPGQMPHLPQPKSESLVPKPMDKRR